MNARTGIVTAVEVAVVVGAVVLLAGAFLGEPVLVSHVTSGSMESALAQGDGFVAVPAALAGPVEAGDVIVFRAEELRGGGLTTHRVVEETPEGYVTKGDANPSTDQSGGEPPVKDAQVVAVAFQANGAVLTIPQLGTVVTGLQDLANAFQNRLPSIPGLGAQNTLPAVILGVSILAYGWELRRERSAGSGRARDRNRDTGVDPRLVVLVFAGAIVLAATAAMVAPAGTTEYGFVSSIRDTAGANVIPSGASETTTYATSNDGVLPVFTILETSSRGVSIDPPQHRVTPGGTVESTVTITAPDEIGHYRRYVVEHRYLAVLPESTIGELHAVHPWLPIAVIDALLGLPVYLLGVALVGRGRVHDRTRDRPLGLTLRRALRRRYR